MSKPKDFFRYSEGLLQSEGIALSRIANEVGTPVYVYSAHALLSRFGNCRLAFRDWTR